MRWIAACLGLVAMQLGAQVPTIGVDGRLDVATWNLEWFGDANNGPSNETVQLNYASELINKTDLDLIGVQEISDIAYWNKLLANCPSYGGVLSTWSQTQKTGLLYKKASFDLLYQKHILPNYDYDFGGGRLPLEVGLSPKLGTNNEDTLIVWVLHMKANTGSSSQKVLAYNRRYNAGLALKMYVDALPKHHQGIVMGDWNDDFDQSILSGYSTPYPNWVKDTNFVITSLPLSQSRQKSTVSYYEMIDHIVASPALKSRWIKDSSMVLYADKWLSGYANNLSDHYPVYARFSWESSRSTASLEIEKKELVIQQNANGLFFSWEAESTPLTHSSMHVYDLLGRKYSTSKQGYFQDLAPLSWYAYQIIAGNQLYKGLFMLNLDGTISYR